MRSRASVLSALCLVLASWYSGVGMAAAQSRTDPATTAAPPGTVTRDANSPVTVHATRLSRPLSIDGRLDDEVYHSVAPATGFVQQEPHDGQPATEKTDTWILFDDENLYVSARCWDSHPERLVANDMRRDGDLSQNDNLTVTLDTFFDRRNGFYFQTNPLGGLRDQQVYDDRQNNEDWNTIWNVKARRDEQGWTVEIVIPFKSLRYKGSGPQTWGVNVKREVKWNNETSFLSPVPASHGRRAVFKMSSSATLVGLAAPPATRNLELKPYLKSGLQTNTLATPVLSNDLSGTGGLDVKYGITSGLTADFTVNTDFAQVEADDQQVNLTRFNLFFPEKRDFFLEGQGIFAFGGASLRPPPAGTRPILDTTSQALTPVLFFSRRIGLDDGREVPIRAGGRVTGRSGPYTIGLLNIESGERPEAQAARTNFSVVRLRRDVLRRSAIGILATSRSLAPNGTGSSQLYGADASLLFFQNLMVNGYYARTRAGGDGGDGTSYSGKVNWAADRYGVALEHITAGRGFSPDVGFMARSEFRRTYGYARFSPRPHASPFFRKLTNEVSLDYITTPEGRLQSREALATFRADFHNGDQVLLQASRNFEDLAKPFTISKGVSIAPGGYGWGEARATYYIAPQRTLNGRVNVSQGSFYDGRRTVAGLNARLNLGARLGIEPRIALNWVDLPAGQFTARVIGANTTMMFSPRMSLTALVQYNSSSNTLTSNIRLRWEYIPGSDFFIVYNDGRDTLPSGFPALSSRQFVVKVTRLVRH